MLLRGCTTLKVNDSYIHSEIRLSNFKFSQTIRSDTRPIHLLVAHYRLHVGHMHRSAHRSAHYKDVRKCPSKADMLRLRNVT